MKNLAPKIEEAVNSMLTAIAAFSDGQFNKVAFEGSWTPAQVADHIYKSIKDAPAMFNGPVEETDRKPDQHEQQISDIFLDMGKKMKSPDFILPSAAPLDKQEMYKATENAGNELLNAVNTLDMSQTVLSAEFPGMGYFTRYEWTWQMYTHIVRHTQQLENIHKKMGSS